MPIVTVDKSRLSVEDIDDAKGDLCYVGVDRLKIDPLYQRDSASNTAKINDLAKTWSWIACGVLSVAKRKNGDLYCFDGAHYDRYGLRFSG